MMIDPGASFLKSIQHNNASPLWSGYVVWTNYQLDVNVFPRSRNSHLNEWGNSNNKDLFPSNSRIRYNADLSVNIQLVYSKPSWNSSSQPLITEDVKNAFFGNPSSRQSVHIVMKMTSYSSHFVSHIEATSAYVSGFAFIPVQKGESLMPLHPLRPLVIDLNSEKILSCGEYYYFKAWILNENFIIPFFKYVSLKIETDNTKQSNSSHPSSRSSSLPFHTPQPPPPPSGLPPYYNPSMSRAFPFPYSKNHSHHLQSMSSCSNSNSSYNDYNNFQRQQLEITNKYIQNSAQKSQSSVIKPIPMYPFSDSSKNSDIHFRADQHSMIDINKKLDFSSDSVFKALLQRRGRPYSGEGERFHPSQNDDTEKKLSNLRIYSPKGQTSSSLHHLERTSNNNIPEDVKTRAPQIHQPPPPPLPPLSSHHNPKNSNSNYTSQYEKNLSEFVNTLFSWQEDMNETLNLLDKIVPLLISSEYEDKMLLEKIHDLFNTFYKGQKGNIPQEYEKWEVKIELQFANTLKKCPYNFKHDLATHLLKERDTLLMNQKKKERKLKKRIFEAVIKTEEHTMKRKTIGVFSGNFNERLVHFNTVILENVSVPLSYNYSPFSNLYCLFIAKDMSLFSWDKWKDNKVLISTSHSKMSAIFYLDDSVLNQFNLPVKFMEHSEDFNNYISTEKDSKTSKKACLISFTNFYHYFQTIEKIFKIEPLITWKPIIFSRPSVYTSNSSTSTSSSQVSAIQKSKEQDPFYGLLMTVFGNRVYGLSYRKRIKLKFEFGEINSFQYHALIFNNNIVFISEDTASNFLLEIDNLIFGCESFETFLIKNDRIPTDSNSVLKLKIPITSRKVNPPKDSLGNSTSIIPNVLIKAKILNHEQLNNLEFLKKEISDGESFIVERKQSLIIFQNTLKGHIKSEENYQNSSIMDFRMMRKIGAIAKMRVVIRNVQYDLIVFYFISFMKSEGSELVFVNNSENEVIGRGIDVLISPLSENTLRLVSKSNFSSSVLLTRKDKSTWAMITDINEPIRCIGRIIMPNTFKNIIWEAIKCKDMFFSDMENIRCAFSSSNKICTIKSWEKLYGVDDQSFKDFHQSKETLESWDYNLDYPQNPMEDLYREDKKYKRPPKKKSQDEKYLKPHKKSKDDEALQEVDVKKEEITNPIKKRKSVFEIFDEGTLKEESVEPTVSNILQSIPLKKRMIRADSPSSTLSSSSPPLTIDIDEYNCNDNLNENLLHIKDEPHFSPKVIIPERDRIEADSYLNQNKTSKNTGQDDNDDEEVINVIKCIVNDIEHNGTKSNNL